MRGDPSDGLPGVNGIGAKTAAALVARFGTIEQIVAAAESGRDGLPAGAVRKVLDARAYLGLAVGVVRGRTDADVGEHDARLPLAPADAERVVELADRYGLDGSINRVLSALGEVASRS